PALTEALDHVGVAELDHPERRLRPRDRDRRGRERLAVEREQRAEVDVDELVAVQCEDVAALAALARCEPQAAAAAEPLRLLGAHDLDSEAGELAHEEFALSHSAGDDHAGDARTREAPDLVRGERTTGDVDERLRPSARSVAEALGLAAGEDD